ncbi:MAG: amidohydrolase [Telmatospirillum sp.]|nr:amidohydrolase [Telmatospirillum sp.]
MIVDCHVNVYEDSQILPLYGQIAGIARAGGFKIQADPATVEAAMRDVDRAIVFSLRYADSIGIDGDDEVTARLVARDPKKFVGFACLDPRMPNCMDLLVHAVEDLGLKGVKFGPIYNGVSLLDPRLEPVYRYLVKKNLPLTMHMGTTFGQNAPIEYGRPLDVDAVARRHPDLKMIMAHMGHPWYEECIVVARKNANVYCEVSALYYRPWQFYNILVCAQEYGIVARDKIFWGTDFPFTTVADSIAGFKRVNDQIEGTKLPCIADETIDRILHSNPLAHWWHGGYPG